MNDERRLSPSYLEKKLEEEKEMILHNFSLSSLRDAYEALSRVYKDGQGKGTNRGITHSSLFPIAYLMARSPATLEVLRDIMTPLKNLLPSPLSFLDIGAGLGLSAVVMKEIFPTLNQIVLKEPQKEMRALGQKILEKLPLSEVSWQEKGEGGLSRGTSSLHKYDMVLLSYVLNEIPSSNREAVLKEAWGKSRQGLCIIEAGTPEGFKIIKEAREWLLQAGAHLLAPCPHESPCPMGNTNWCHFRARLTRHKNHRFIKRGQLGYEDEKFSYLFATPVPPQKTLGEGRVLSLPRKRPGHVMIDVCTREGNFETWTWSKSHSTYSTAKETLWGQIIPKKP